MADVGRKAGDGTVEVIATLGVTTRLYASELGVSGLSTPADRAEGPLGLRECILKQLFQGLPGGKLPWQITADRG